MRVMRAIKILELNGLGWVDQVGQSSFDELVGLVEPCEFDSNGLGLGGPSGLSKLVRLIEPSEPT